MENDLIDNELEQIVAGKQVRRFPGYGPISKLEIFRDWTNSAPFKAKETTSDIARRLNGTS